MPALITYTLLIAFVLSAFLAAYDGWIKREKARSGLEMSLLVAAFLMLRWQTGFPAIRESFSSTPTAAVVGVMFICVVLGTVANYMFYLKASFSWRSLVRPIVVSPLVLLPLLGTLEGHPQVETVQLIWFALLAFQNGFFWRIVFDHAKPTIK